MYSPLPIAVLYAGLAGMLLALLIATAQNRWSCRVFFLLALRLAIGWHFLFEGLHKLNSHLVGPTETNRPFSSEPYFRNAPGPVAAYMRRQFDDPLATIDAKVKAPKPISADEFAKLTVQQQAEACPQAVAEQLDAMLAKAEESAKAQAKRDEEAATAAEKKAETEADEAAQRALKGQWSAEEFAQIRAKADDERDKARTLADGRRGQIRERLAAFQDVGRELVAAIKAKSDGEMPARQLEAALAAVSAKAEDDQKAATAAEKKAIEEATATEQRTLKGQWTEAEKGTIRAKAEADRKRAKEIAELSREVARRKGETAKEDAPKRVVEAKAEYARWVYGVDGRATTVKGINGEVSFTGPERLEHLDWLRKQAQESEARRTAGLGNGQGTEQKRAAEVRTALLTAESDLARDADAFVAELKKYLNGGDEVKEEKPESRGQMMDWATAWFLVVVGACLMAGLFTRLACLLGAGFLVMTYLTYPPFPWYPLPLNTEGNPLFINKNVIECIALLALACMPTGRWLGLDAIVLRPFCRYKGDPPAA
jgi:uncharacterized membrane protein YphA (DoxX/SURF4 family)